MLAAASGLLRLLLLRLWTRDGGAAWASPADAPRAFFHDAVWVDLTGSFFSTLAMVMLLTFATRSCEATAVAGVQYASFLSLLDFGDTVGGLVTTPIANALGIRYGHFQPLSDMLYISAGCRMAVCVLVPLLVARDDEALHSSPRRQSTAERQRA